MKIAAFAAALVYLVSLVTADHLDVGTPGLRPLVPGGGVITNTIDANNNNVLVSKSNIVLSKSDRVQLAKVIKEMLASHPEANLVAANLILEQLEQDGGTGTVANVATNRAVISHAVNILASTISGNPAAAAGHTVGLISAAYPVVMAPVPSPVATRYTPSITITMSPVARGVIPRATPRFFPASPSS
ncbi:hypothetical protein V7S43_007947 [Phytophthora oleae]|uniref:RxLR effector protein n=1 Tax=Phytophthora oleae TaxID=2107226 RepID=A0ABD3FKS5_9STRA